MRREEAYRKALLKKVQKLLKAKDLKFQITQEYYFNSGKMRSYVDLVIHTPKKTVPVEIKHDASEWTKKQLKSQLARYNRHFSQERKAEKTLLVSPRGRYGLDESAFLETLEAML